jgi:hypothetical protein
VIHVTPVCNLSHKRDGLRSTWCDMRIPLVPGNSESPWRKSKPGVGLFDALRHKLFGGGDLVAPYGFDLGFRLSL